MSRYVQVGVAALRAPDGRPLPAVPLFIREDDAARTGERLAAEGIPVPEDELAQMLAGKFRQYAEGVRRAERSQ